MRSEIAVCGGGNFNNNWVEYFVGRHIIESGAVDAE